MDQNDSRELARLYKIANAIGNSLDTEAVLSAALSAFVEQLACSAGAIFLDSSVVAPDAPAVAVPSTLRHNAAVQIGAALLGAQMTAAERRTFCHALPQQGHTAAGEAYLLLPLGGEGMVVLFGCRVAVSPAFVLALTPLLARLLGAYHICLQHAELAAAHRCALLENNAAAHTLSVVLQTVGEGILGLDEDGRILMVNAELEHLFGCTEAHLLGTPFDALLAAADALPPFPDQCDGVDAWRNLTGIRFETEGRRKDGSTFPVEVCINELAPGLPLRFAGSLRDISERRENDRLRDEFVSTVSHELRTPLTAIMGWTETLLTEHPGPVNDMQRRFLNTVYASSQRLNRLIEEILTVSRVQRGALRINSEPMSPSELLSTVWSDLAPSAERQRVRLHFDDAWPAGEPIMGDRHLLEHVLNSLIDNALKFSPQDSDVFVRSRLTPIGWRVEIEDHGMGVRAADLPKLFNRFVRGSNAKEAHTQGAGLGLFVSKAIVEAHGGTIYLTSREGEGTTAAYELPRQRFYGSTELSYAA